MVRLAAGITVVGLGGTGVCFAQVGERAVQASTGYKLGDGERTAALKCMGDTYRLNNAALCKANNTRLAAIAKTAQTSGNEAGGVVTAAPSNTNRR